MTQSIPAEQFVAFLAANVDSPSLSDEAFRTLVRNSLPVVQGVQPQGSRSSGSQFDDTAAWTQR